MYNILLNTMTTRDMVEAGDNGVLALLVLYTLPLGALCVDFIIRRLRSEKFQAWAMRKLVLRSRKRAFKKDLVPVIENGMVNTAIKNGDIVSIVFSDAGVIEFEFSHSEEERVFFLNGNHVTCDEMMLFLLQENAKFYRL